MQFRFSIKILCSRAVLRASIDFLNRTPYPVCKKADSITSFASRIVYHLDLYNVSPRRIINFNSIA